MRPLLAAALIGAAALCAVRAEEASYGADSPVTVATTSNFDEVIKSKKVALVEFYAPWCGHCKALKPQYEVAAKEVRDRNLDAVVVAVDATTETDLASKFGVQGYPTIKAFVNGELKEDYQGARSSEGLVSFVEEQLLPTVVTADTEERVEELKKKRLVAVLGHFDEQNAVARDAFVAGAEKLRANKTYAHVFFVEITDPAVALKYGIMGSPGLRIFKERLLGNVKPGEEPTEVEFDFFSESGWNSNHLLEFLRQHSFVTLGEISPDTYAVYAERDLPILWLFTDEFGKDTDEDEDEGEKSEDSTKKNTPEMEAKAKEHRILVREAVKDFADKISATFLSGRDYGDHASSLGVDKENLPGIVITRGEELADKWRFQGELDAGTLRRWIEQVLAGTAKQFKKSAPIPEENATEAVKTIVADTLEQYLFESGKDVFVEFYAPWCGHCKAVAPIWEQLAETLKDDDSIIIAKMDAIANDVPPKVTGFPMFYFHKASSKGPKLDEDGWFEGDRTLKAFLKFVKEKKPDVKVGRTPPDMKVIKQFIDQLEDIKSELQNLVHENEALKARTDDKQTSKSGADSETASSKQAPKHDEL